METHTPANLRPAAAAEPAVFSSTPDRGRRGRGRRATHARSLVEDVVEQVARKITVGELVPGEKLPTEQLMMQTYGVSRTVVREAISRLQAANMVETRHGIGTFVLAVREKSSGTLTAPTLVTMYDVLDMLEFRICLETQAAGLAALKRTEDDLQVLDGILQTFAAQIHGEATAVAEDVEFHTRICKATGNRYFEDFYRFIGQNTIPRMRLKITQYAQEPDKLYLTRLHAEHTAVYDAIARQDSESAQAAMRIHLVNSRERLRKVLELEKQQNTV